MTVLKGIIPPIITPMNEDESINEPELRRQVNRLIEAGVHGLFPFGTNGEGYILTEKEKERVLSIVIEETDGRVPVYAGSGCIGTKDTIRMCRMAESLGADVLSVITPWFAKASDEEDVYKRQDGRRDRTRGILLESGEHGQRSIFWLYRQGKHGETPVSYTHLWDEVPSCFYGTWKDPLWRGLHLRRLKAMARKQNYHSSVVLCSVFNESWGILGDHERSPWDNDEAQNWIRTSAQTYRRLAPGILVVDNSGYGKTGETDILDYHSYPTEFADAMDFFERLDKQNYPGSAFNCYNEENRQLMRCV